MIATSIDRLLQISSPPLGQDISGELSKLGKLSVAQAELLRKKNGFYGFESALHVFPTAKSSMICVEDWNASDLWRDSYAELAQGLIFFAEDVFGNQFCISETGIGLWEAETGQMERVAKDFEEWASRLLEDYDFLTGYSLAHEWQELNGILKPGFRLLPKIPFVAAGKYEVANLYACDSIKAMRFRGELACQIKDVPDGSRIELGLLD